MKKISWKKVLQDPLFVKGEIEIQEIEKTYRGPIKEITTKGGDILFHLLWCAHYDTETKKWKIADHETTAIINRSKTTVKLSRAGHLFLQNPVIIMGKIFPENGDRLNPAEVEGLDLDNLPGPHPAVELG